MPSVSPEAHLTSLDPAQYLPHRYPFLLLDRITELQPGVRGVAQSAVTANRGFPQMLLVESVAQLAGCVVAQQEGESGFLASIDHAEFSSRPLIPGDTLTITAQVVKSFGRLFMIAGNVSSGSEELLSVQLTLGVGKI